MLSTQQPISHQGDPQGRPAQGLPVRELVPAVSVMQFWDKILDKAMAKFMSDNRTVPKKLVENPDYTIRELESWPQIYKKLQSATEEFDSSKSKFFGGAKKTYRYVADKSSNVLKPMVDALPDGTYVTPVKIALKVLLDVSHPELALMR